jgi:hypothetical protein
MVRAPQQTLRVQHRLDVLHQSLLVLNDSRQIFRKAAQSIDSLAVRLDQGVKFGFIVVFHGYFRSANRAGNEKVKIARPPRFSRIGRAGKL